MATKNGRIPSELLFELISALPFDIRWAFSRVSKAFDGFVWQKQFPRIRAELIHKSQKKTQFLQTVNALFVSAQCFHPKLFDQNEVLFDERIKYLRYVQKTMDTMAATFAKSQDAEEKRRKRRHSGP
ncbi:hypothetical protein niasHT_030848 [Heterodera trifolii]|uniref:F-box domain-containing protein n=1 Tax=Heterodera trifolii TaxID=157864 RepID=A0ABD2HNZ3_9BILA